MQVSEAIRQRHSVRQYLDKPVPQELIRQILELARHAPSGANTQPWQVAVLTGASRQRLVQTLTATFEAEQPADPDYHYYPTQWQSPYLERRRACGLQLYQSLGIERKDKQAQKAQWAANFRGFDAPVMLIFWMDEVMQTGSYLDMGLFLQTMMLAATDLGLATCPQAALAEYPQLIKDQLALPMNCQLIAGMALGYEDSQAPVNQYRTEREAIDCFTQFFD